MSSHSGMSAISGGKPVLRPEDLDVGSLYRGVRDAVIVGDLVTARVVLWNPAAERIFGYSAEDAIGMPIEQLIPERLRDEFRATLQGCTDDNSGATEILKEAWEIRETPALHKSGSEIIIEYSASPLESPAYPTYFLGIVRDCTERKRMETSRETLLASAQDSARRMGELASFKDDVTSMIAHEFGTSLSAIRAVADLLDRDGISEADRRHFLRTIQAETQLLERLVSDVYVEAVMDGDDFSVRMHPVGLEPLLTEAARSLEVQLTGHPFIRGPIPDVQVLADNERIGQVLRNLLCNACKHTPPGTAVTLQAREENGSVRIEVSDQGPGIDPDDLPLIFRKYWRGRHKRPGAGLGLYLSRRIVHAHEGELEVVSEPGQGATFGFSVKVVP